MTTKKNLKLKKVSNQYTRFFDLKKLLPKTKTESVELFGRETVFAQCTRKPIQKPRKIVKSPIQWVHTDNVVQTQQGSPYMLVSKDQSEDQIKPRPKNAICYNVLHEPPAPPPRTTKNIEPLLKGIRISICLEHTRFPLIGKVSKNMGLTHVPEHRLWNIQWCDNTPHLDLLKAMKRFQQINHFPGMSEICRKDMLALNLNRMLKRYPGDYRIFPKTWLMPSDTYEVAIYANKHKRTYILKPYSSGQGRGIWLTNNLRTVGRQEKLICQTYIDRPLLIDGFKFDLRVYTLVTSVDPLRIFVYNEGLARFATHKYMPPALGNSNNVFMHLTNYCVNRRNSNYNAGKGHEGGSKRKLCEYNKWLKDHNYNVEEFWSAVDDAIIKTVMSAWPVLKHNYHVCFPRHDKIQACFQLLGFDILVDWKLKPFILEVNHTPSLCGDETVDNEVKRPLIRDTLNLISSPLVDKEEIIREDRRALRERLLCQQGKRQVRTPIQPGSNPTRAAGGGELRQPCSIGALAQQIAWEESHLGNYRRVMPPTDSDKVSYYCKFYDQVKQVSMFKETTTSKSRMRLNVEHIRQQKLQEQLDLERQRQIRFLQERKLKSEQSIIQDTKNNPTQLQQKRKEDLIAQDIQRQQQKFLISSPVKQTVHVWQTIDKDDQAQTNLRLKSKCSVNLGKTKRRQQHLQKQRRTRRARRLELESLKDAEFLQEHGITCPAGVMPQTESSKVQVMKNKNITLDTCKRQKPNRPNLKCSKKNKANKLANEKKINHELNKWLPEPISSEEQQSEYEWRKKRADTLNHWQLKELLFTEMFKRGDLTKTDIQLSPFLLYRILRQKSLKRFTDHKYLFDTES